MAALIAGTDPGVAAWYGASFAAVAIGVVVLLTGRSRYLRLVAGAFLVIAGIAAAVVLSVALLYSA